GWTAAALEIIEAGGAHRCIHDAAEIDPDVAVLARKGRSETEVARRPLPAPEIGVTRRPLRPQVRGAGVRRRSEREDVHEHAFVEADPIGWDQPLFWMPAHRDRLAPVAAEKIPVGAFVQLLSQVAD